jgi:hypothetical protein
VEKSELLKIKPNSSDSKEVIQKGYADEVKSLIYRCRERGRVKGNEIRSSK